MEAAGAGRMFALATAIVALEFGFFKWRSEEPTALWQPARERTLSTKERRMADETKRT